jgi:chloride channel protein, CIC family
MFNRLSPSGNIILIALAMAVGLVSGLGAYAFHMLVEVTHAFAFESHLVPHEGIASVLRMVLAPTCGGLVVGTLVWLLARHDHSHGTASVMEAVALHGGRLNPRPFFTKIFSAGLLIGAGGSAGPEDPGVQIGAVIGSSVGERLGLSVARINTLITAGVASAIAAAFNAPIAGVFFALEIVASDFSATMFAPVVLASVVASIVGRALMGSQPAFQAPPHALVNPLLETPLYALLGLVAAGAGALFIRALFLSEAGFDRLRLPIPMRAALGGLLVGLLALLLGPSGRLILGSSYETASQIIYDAGPVGGMLLLLLATKYLATICTLGAVRVGGTFAPSMVLGAMIGGLFGEGVTALFPGMTASPAAYALVGMGAMLNAVVRAPITAVLLLFEVTGDYHIILAIMASVVTSHLLAHRLHPESIYTERLARKGIHLRFGRDMNILELVTVGEAMTPNFDTIRHTATLSHLIGAFSHTHHHGFPVVDDEGHLFGIVTLTDLQRATDEGVPLTTPVEQIATRDLIVVYPEQSLNVALNQFAQADVGRLPVVDRRNPCRLLGVVRRSDIIKAYRRAALQRSELEHRHQQMHLGGQCDTHVIEMNVLPGSASDGRAVRDLHLPEHVIITAIRRNGETIIPRGSTILHGEDHLTLLAIPEQVPQIEESLLHGTGDDTEPRYHEIVLTRGAPAVGKKVAELSLPPDVLIVTLRQDGHTQAVHGNTVLTTGDELTILSPPSDLEEAIYCLSGR